jgi:hypothetical protein
VGERKGLETDEARVLATVARLVTAADGDTLCRDLYLGRAAQLLAPLVTEARYQDALRQQELLGRVLGQARAAVERKDWARVRELGARGADLRRGLDAEHETLAAAAAVYGAPAVALDPLSPGLTRLTKRWPDAARARAETSAVLAELTTEDPTAGTLYASRRKALDALSLPGAATGGARGSDAPRGGGAELQALQALERGDAEALRNLAEAMLGSPGAASPATGAGAPALSGRIAVPATLTEPFPDACLPRLAALGFERVEAAPVSDSVARVITEFVERYALGASAAVYDLARDGVARVMLAADEAAVPSEVAKLFAETVSLFALHLYVNSAGLRYVPVPVPREVLLVEPHADGEEPVTPLLRELGFERRRGLARDDIEAALLRHGTRIVAERLGLDPLAYRIVCVPPDAYVRVGRDRGWGTREEWTHLDGYQVLSTGRLRALVGGNARYGGLADLCSISRDDRRENVVARFAVIRRDRLGVRLG